jgi:membrane protein implicated in regulation of membrane protease activity
MNYRAIIRDSWALTQENKRFIWWFAFLPAMLATVVGMVYFGYQVASFYFSPHFNHHLTENAPSAARLVIEESLKIIDLSPGLGTFLVVIAAIVALAHFIVPVFSQGALIQLVAHVRAGRKVSVLQGLSFGLSRFLQLFEFSLVVRTFGFVSLLTEFAFVLRNLGPESVSVFGIIFAVVFVVAMVLTLLFTYSEYYIVIDKRGVFSSMLASGGLVIRQLHHTLFMLLLMVIISARIIINIIVALLIPLLIVGPIVFFASMTMTIIGVIIGVVIGFIALYFASYFLGIFHVFATAVWTFTFLELTTQEEELDLRAKAVKEEDEEVEEAEENNPF